MVVGGGSWLFSLMIEVKSVKGGSAIGRDIVQHKIGPRERGLVCCLNLFYPVVRLWDETSVYKRQRG
jgi:hypothetical protein